MDARRQSGSNLVIYRSPQAREVVGADRCAALPPDQDGFVAFLNRELVRNADHALIHADRSDDREFSPADQDRVPGDPSEPVGVTDRDHGDFFGRSPNDVASAVSDRAPGRKRPYGDDPGPQR